jgi:dUTP pyrophosphatase
MTTPSSILRFVKITENALTPYRRTPKSAGFKLRSAYDYTVKSRDNGLIYTDIKIQLPTGCYGRIAPCSDVTIKDHISIAGGVIDEDYRGNIGVILFNHSEQPFEISRGDRIAQIICENIYYPELMEVTTLDYTQRGSERFGSTGKN